MYLDTSVDSILKGLGHQLYSMIINIADATLSVILVRMLLPRFGIMGYIATVYFTESVNAALSITKLLLVTKTRVRVLDWIAKPILAAIISCCAVRLILLLGQYTVCSTSALILFIIIIALIYLCVLVLLGAISPKAIKRSVLNLLRSK
jgi:stage V sporulation protein B